MLRIIVCHVAATALALGASITVGAPGDSFNGDCAPFGCALEYQQVYGAGLFPGIITITDLTFFNLNFVPGDIAPANYTISLSTTSAAVNGLNATFASNVGADNQTFFSGPLGGTIGPANQFTISGTPFNYNPSTGNLLLHVIKDRGESDFSVFLDFSSAAAPGTFSRAYGFDSSGVASVLENDTGLVTEFTYTPAGEVPELGSIWLVSVGIALAWTRRSSRI